MDYYDSYYDNDDDWMSMCTEMTNTIDALNTNIILLNKFIESAVDLYDCSMNFKENIEITSFDASGNILTCVKSDGSGNFFPCVFMDLSSNLIPCVLPPDDNSANMMNTNRERSFSPLSPYYYPYYSPYYNPYYNPYYSPYYNPYYNPYYPSLLDNVSAYREIPVKNMMSANESNDDPLFHHPTHNPKNNHPMHRRPPYYPPHYRPQYYPPHYRPPYYPPHYRPPYYPPYYPIYNRSQYNESMNK